MYTIYFNNISNKSGCNVLFGISDNSQDIKSICSNISKFTDSPIAYASKLGLHIQFIFKIHNLHNLQNHVYLQQSLLESLTF